MLKIKRPKIMMGKCSYPGSSYPTWDDWRQSDRPLQVRLPDLFSKRLAKSTGKPNKGPKSRNTTQIQRQFKPIEIKAVPLKIS